MKIRETLFSKSFSVENSDPYGLSLDFMHSMSENYLIYERKNMFETDGPVKKAFVVFDIVEMLDKFAHIFVSFSMESENNALFVDISGEFVVQIKEEGAFTNIFTEFYLNNIFPQLKRVSQQKFAKLNTEVDAL